MLESLQTNDPLLVIIAFFVVLIPLILIHELGHFLAAKAVGITILEFGIGFPPRIRKLFTWRETEFTLNWIPLGGFVRPLGEDMIRPLDEKTLEKEKEEFIARHQDGGLQTLSSEAISAEAEKPRSYTGIHPKSVNEANPIGRIFFMSAGALANFALALVLFAIVALLVGVPIPAVAVLDVSSNSPLGKAGLQSGDVITAVDGQPFNVNEDFYAQYRQSGKSVTLTVQRAREADPFQIVVPPVAESEQSVPEYALIVGVVQGAPADTAGIKPGDIVIAFNSEPISGIDDLKARTAQNLGKVITLTLRRGSEEVEVKLTPRTNPPEGQGAMGISINKTWDDTAGGVTYFLQTQIVPPSLAEAAQYSLSKLSAVISTTVTLPSKVIRGEVSPQDARPISVLGMSQIGSSIIQESIQQKNLAPILDFIGTISVALGFFNLLPIPALDGGRIVFVLVEILRGRPMAPEREGLVHLIGLALLLSLSVLIILNDVINPITNTVR